MDTTVGELLKALVDRLTADDIPKVRAGNYISITGKGSVYANSEGNISFGDGVFSHCGIRVEVIGDKHYSIDADVCNIDEYADVFESGSPAMLDGATMTLTGSVKRINSDDVEMGYQLFDFDLSSNAKLTYLEP